MAAKIPQVKTDDSKFIQYQQQVAKALQPVLECPISYGTLLKEIPLVTGLNTIPHKLGRTLQGWFFVRQRAVGTPLAPALISIQDSQDANRTPQSTLLLYASADINVDIWVY